MDVGRPFAVFTAGGIGAGKTLMADLLCRHFVLASLDADAITAAVAARRPNRTHWASRPAALHLLDRWQDKLIELRAPMLVNTTAADLGFVRLLQARLAQNGYRTAIIFVHSPLTDCIARNALRDHPRPDAAVLATHRACTAHRDELAAIFRHFQAITNLGDECAFTTQLGLRIIPWLQRLGIDRHQPKRAMI